MLEPESTIFAVEPWTEDSRAFLVALPAWSDFSHQHIDFPVDGATYFIEVFIAVEFLEGFAKSEPAASIEERCSRLIYYAIYDP